MGAEVKSMEVKKTEQVSADQNYSVRRVRDFAGEVKSEIQKITWTSRDELRTYTKIVVGATFLFGMAIYFLDLLIQGTLSSLNSILSFISG